MAAVTCFAPPRHREGDHAQHSGGGVPNSVAHVELPFHHALKNARSPSPCRGGAAALIVFPAIDLKTGKVVRLEESDMTAP